MRLEGKGSVMAFEAFGACLLSLGVWYLVCFCCCEFGVWFVFCLFVLGSGWLFWFGVVFGNGCGCGLGLNERFGGKVWVYFGLCWA